MISSEINALLETSMQFVCYDHESKRKRVWSKAQTKTIKILGFFFPASADAHSSFLKALVLYSSVYRNTYLKMNKITFEKRVCHTWVAKISNL